MARRFTIKIRKTRRGRPRNAVIGTTEEGQQCRWRDIYEAAASLGTTPGTLRVYMCQDKLYKGYSFDFAPSDQLTLF